VIKVLIDSSSWIHFFRQTSTRHYQVVSDLLKEDRVVTCGLILTEVFRGARNEKERRLLINHFEILEYIPLEKTDFLLAGNLGTTLRQKGLTVKTIDLLIAHLALKHKLTLLHDDSDFEFIARHTLLKTTQV